MMAQWLPYINHVLAVFSYFCQIAATVVFLHCFYDHAFCWNKKIALILVVYLILNRLLQIFVPSLQIPMLWESFIFSLISISSYTGNRFRGFGHFFWVHSVISICAWSIETVAGQYLFGIENIFQLFTSAPQKIFLNLVYLVYFSVVFFYLYAKIYRKGLLVKWQTAEHYFILIYTVSYFIIYIIISFYGTQASVSLAIMGVVFVLAALLLPIFIYYLRISRYRQERTIQQQLYMQAELAHFQQYKLAQEETARFRHDIKNNLLCMHHMLQQGKNEEANQYLEHLLEGVDTLSARYVTGDEILDSIVAFKAQKMETQGITFQLDGVLAGGLKWKPVDICNVFANALDNAIEACERLPQDQRQITMAIKATTQYWFVRIENPVLEPVDTKRLFKKKDGYTSKANPEQHGMGTYNMKHTVEANGGILRAEYANNRFTLEIMIDKSSS